jgi:hypothetical protein
MAGSEFAVNHTAAFEVRFARGPAVAVVNAAVTVLDPAEITDESR